MENDILSIIYKDARGNITARDVLSVSESGNYIQGLCYKSGDLKTFRKDRILEKIGANDDREIRLQYHISIHPEPKEVVKRKMNIEGGPEVCFTGFKKDDKERLLNLARNEGLFIRTSVTTKLDYLCCGDNAGPKKIEKARHQGVVALNEPQFLSLIQTGEIPDDE